MSVKLICFIYHYKNTLELLPILLIFTTLSNLSQNRLNGSDTSINRSSNSFQTRSTAGGIPDEGNLEQQRAHLADLCVQIFNGGIEASLERLGQARNVRVGRCSQCRIGRFQRNFSTLQNTDIGGGHRLWGWRCQGDLLEVDLLRVQLGKF